MLPYDNAKGPKGGAGGLAGAGGVVGAAAASLAPSWWWRKMSSVRAGAHAPHAARKRDPTGALPGLTHAAACREAALAAGRTQAVGGRIAPPRRRWVVVGVVLLAAAVLTLRIALVDTHGKTGSNDNGDGEDVKGMDDAFAAKLIQRFEREQQQRLRQKEKQEQAAADAAAAAEAETLRREAAANNGDQDDRRLAQADADPGGDDPRGDDPADDERGGRGAVDNEDDADASAARHGAAASGPWPARRGRVVQAIQHAWRGYRDYAWGMDELLPLSHSGSDWFHLGLTIVDSLDTLWLAGLTAEYNEAREWVATSLQLDVDSTVNLFEVTIRVLGGLLSAYYLTQDQMYLDRATDLGDRLMGGFTSSHTAVPFASVNLRSRSGVRAHFAGGASSTSEVTTLQLEFAYLSALTGDDRYRRVADAVIAHVDGLRKQDGLVPVFISPDSGQFSGGELKMGARGDSYYEYLLKQDLQRPGTDHGRPKRMYTEAMQGVRRHLMQHSSPSGLTFIAEKEMGASFVHPKMDHLVCFLPGVLALGATRGRSYAGVQDEFSDDDAANWRLAEELMRTCFEMYKLTATGLAPEIVYFNLGPNAGGSDMYIQPLDRHNLLRPETVESLFVMYRLTNDVKYREWGWEIFEAFETHTRVASGGYACLDDVTRLPPPKRDKMESFFIAETLKYLLLLFGDPNVLPLTSVVFNTEAHPLPVLQA